MTDKEKLEMAAKAAGMAVNTHDGFVWCENVGPNKHWGLWRDISHIAPGNPNPRCVPGCWNPLTDDGDALRLVVALRMDILQFDDRVGCGVDLDEMNGELKKDDPYAATRRAIVRAAAEIGKTVGA